MSDRATDSEVARGFLLGTLADDQRERVSERLFCDEDFYREVLAIEADLMDAFVTGELSPEEGERFRANCLASASQLEKLRFASALQEAVGSGRRDFAAVMPESRSPSARWRPWLISGLAAAAAGLAILLAFFQQQQFGRRSQDLQSPQAELEQQLGRQADSSAGAGPSPGVTLFLGSAVLRGRSDLTEIHIPSGTGRLDLRVEVQSPREAPSYRLMVVDASGATVFQQADLVVQMMDETPVVASSIPVQGLAPGVYEVELSAQTQDGRMEPVSYSYFRVARPD